MMNRHVAVLMGGWSGEREISLSSGKACATALEKAGYRVSRVDVSHNIGTILADLRPDVVFNALHGPFGEDGTIQGMLELMQIPYTHSGVLASALAMDKERAKIIAKAANIPVAPWKVMNRLEAAQHHTMAPPYVIKPVGEGSSLGILIIREDHIHPPQELYASDWCYGDKIMVEEYIPGRELTCAVMGDKVLGVIEIVLEKEKFYNFDAKYCFGGSKHFCPAEIKPNIYQKIQELSLEVHQAMGCRGISRSDFRLDDRLTENEKLVWLEVNTQPGMTPTSLVPELARYAGYDFVELVCWMTEESSCCR